MKAILIHEKILLKVLSDQGFFPELPNNYLLRKSDALSAMKVVSTSRDEEIRLLKEQVRQFKEDAADLLNREFELRTEVSRLTSELNSIRANPKTTDGM